MIGRDTTLDIMGQIEEDLDEAGVVTKTSVSSPSCYADKDLPYLRR